MIWADTDLQSIMDIVVWCGVVCGARELGNLIDCDCEYLVLMAMTNNIYFLLHNYQRLKLISGHIT